jgi:hypothetical protein
MMMGGLAWDPLLRTEESLSLFCAFERAGHWRGHGIAPSAVLYLVLQGGAEGAGMRGELRRFIGFKKMWFTCHLLAELAVQRLISIGASVHLSELQGRLWGYESG